MGAILPPTPQPTALVLCGDATVPCAVLERTIAAAGFAIVATVDRWSDAVAVVADTTVDVAIVDLALTGWVGMELVRMLRTGEPACEVIVVSPFSSMDLAPLEADGASIVISTDLRPLASALHRIAAERSRA